MPRTVRFAALWSQAGIAALAVAFLYPSIANATLVTIRVLNVSEGRGVVRVALCREVEWQSHTCAYGGNKAATVGIVEVSIEVPPGVYGVLVHHDANGDNQINKTFLGLPAEGIGFSRNAPLRFGFPSFSSVSVPVGGDTSSASVSLLFEPPRASEGR